MSKKLAIYSFLPWLRMGITNQIKTADNDSSVKLRASIDINIEIEGTGGSEGPITKSVPRKIGLYGPGDIIGLDEKTIIKTEPRNWITNFEPNYLASIDFYEEDIPWRYTPAKPDAKGRLRPWMTLVVLKEDEFENGKNLSGKPLPYIEVSDAAQVFPNAEQLWAWAHVHVNEDLIKSDIQTTSVTGHPFIEKISSEANNAVIDEFEKTLNKNPDLAYSRLMCPRRLEENKAYHAFLIPTFESGRLAGLGQDVEAAFDSVASLHATSSAWGDYSGRPDPTFFPFYYRWYFHTGNVGDFEYLVRLLEPKPIDSRVGRRDMNVQDPGANLRGISDEQENGVNPPKLEGILRLGGALRIPRKTMSDDDKAEADKYDNWADPYPRIFQKELAAFINLGEDYSEKTSSEALQNPDIPFEIRTESLWEEDPDPLITAPLYGQWHALVKRLLEEGDNIPDDNWLHELNLDPRFRVAAGLGTKIIQENQETYMENAWKQVGEILEANRRIRFALLAQSAVKYWRNNYLTPMQTQRPGAFLWLTEPLQARILSQGVSIDNTPQTFTVHHWVKTSKVPEIVFSPSMRKFTRPGGRLSKKLELNAETQPVHTLIHRINEGEIQPAPIKEELSEVISPDKLSEELKPQKVPNFLLKWMENHPWLKYLFLAIGILLLLMVGVFSGFNYSSITIGFGSLAGAGLLVGLICIWLFMSLNNWQKQIDQADTLSGDNQTPEAVDDLPEVPNFVLTLPGSGVRFSRGRKDSEEGARFKIALKDVGELLAASKAVAVEPVKPKLNLSAIASSTLAALNPAITIPRFTYGNVKIPLWILDQLEEKFKEAMAYPEFDIPMYKPLIDLSADYFLPNINFIAENSISLLETNQKFIEAYMVGLNHEFARELIWREYPTDQRGSYFRQFWDASSYLDLEATDPEAQREALKDIPPIHRWSKNSSLGDHDHRELPGDNEQEVVLVIRGELLKKYPNAVIYAHRARWQPKEGTTSEPDRKQERILMPLTEEQEENPPRDIVKTPLYEAKADPDIYFFGFDLTAEEAQGVTDEEPGNLDDRPGWFFVIKERPGEPRFGLDIGKTEAGEIEVWNDLAWENVTPAVPKGGFLQITNSTTTIDVSTNTLESDDDEKEAQREEDIQITWNKDMNAAELAYILFQAPVMVAVHGAEMLPTP